MKKRDKEEAKMKRLILISLLLVVILSGRWVYAVPGVTDRVPAASLIVPFFEVGIDVSTNPHDTLLVVTNILVSPPTQVHYHVWDIDGVPTGIQGNISLTGGDTWAISMRDLIAVASSSDKSMLTDGEFYRGFVTIDNVSSATTKNPTESGYPFANYNQLEGFIYYVRLLQGSSNGLPMVPIEAVGSSVAGLLQDFYQDDNREEIDSDARACADQLANGTACSSDSDGLMYRVHSRVFLEPSLNGRSRVVIFTWSPGMIGGPSIFCDADPSICNSAYPYKRYDADGNLEEDTTIRLDHVVNVIDVSGSENGFVSVWNIPSGLNDIQIYGFSINSAQPASISANWDAIFESYIHILY
ncbi:MAG: hypothetical protein Fur0020_06820 [Thermodesulfovibrionia bacterium]